MNLLKGFCLSCVLLLATSHSASAALTAYRNAVLADNPFAYYEFEEKAGSANAADSSGNAFNGLYSNTTLGGTEVGAPVGLGNAAGFSGNGSYVNLPNLGANHTQLTVEAWVNADGLAGGCCTSLFSTDTWTNNAGGGSLHYNVKSGRDIEHALNGGGPANNNTAGGVVQNDTWYHLVTTYNSNTGATEFYVDGNMISSSVHGNMNDVNLSATGQIGGWNGGRNLPGHIDEFAFYDSVLTASQIQAHFDAASQTGGNAVPEPATATLALLGLGGLLMRRKRTA